MKKTATIALHFSLCLGVAALVFWGAGCVQGMECGGCPDNQDLSNGEYVVVDPEERDDGSPVGGNVTITDSVVTISYEVDGEPVIVKYKVL